MLNKTGESLRESSKITHEKQRKKRSKGLLKEKEHSGRRCFFRRQYSVHCLSYRSSALHNRTVKSVKTTRDVPVSLKR